MPSAPVEPSCVGASAGRLLGVPAVPFAGGRVIGRVVGWPGGTGDCGIGLAVAGALGGVGEIGEAGCAHAGDARQRTPATAPTRKRTLSVFIAPSSTRALADDSSALVLQSASLADKMNIPPRFPQVGKPEPRQEEVCIAVK